MVDNIVYVIWNILTFCFVSSAMIISYRNYRRGFLDIWAPLANGLLLCWSLGHILSLYLIFEITSYINLLLFASVFLMCIFRAMRKQSLAFVGMTMAGFGFFISECMTFWSNGLYVQWFSWMIQLGMLGFWTTFLLIPKIETKFKKEEQKIKNHLEEKNRALQQLQKELDGAKQCFGSLEESFQRHIEQAEKLSIFFEISKSMGSEVDREKMLAHIPEEIVKIWKVEYCGLYLWDEEIQALVLRFAAGIEQTVLNRLHFKLGEGVVGWSALENILLRLDAPENDPRFKDKYNALVKNKKMTFNSLLSAPISIDGKNSGVIELINCQALHSPCFTEEDEHLLLTLVNQIGLLLQNVTQYEENRDGYLNIIRSLVNAMEARDPYTRGHSEQTMKYAVAISQKMNLPEEMIEIIRDAASLHDIGKIGVKENILKKSRKLTADEYSHIKNHPFMGAQILKPVKNLQEVVPIVYHHHERYDGKGYLDGLQKDEIPLGARIITVADAFEAMTSDRPYHKGLQKPDAMEQLKKGSGTQFDPVVVDAFLEILEEEPVEKSFFVAKS